LLQYLNFGVNLVRR